MIISLEELVAAGKASTTNHQINLIYLTMLFLHVKGYLYLTILNLNTTKGYRESKS